MSNTFDNNLLADAPQKLRIVRNHVKNVPPELYDLCDYLAEFIELDSIYKSTKLISPYKLSILLENCLDEIKKGKSSLKNFNNFEKLYYNRTHIFIAMNYFPLIIDKIGNLIFANNFRTCFSIIFYVYGTALPPVDETYGKFGAIVIEKNVVDISRKDKATVLAKLYNYAHPQGMGFIRYTPEPMEIDMARDLLRTCNPYFNYLIGRNMKVDFSNPSRFSTSKYNKINGKGIAEILISQCPNIK